MKSTIKLSASQRVVTQPTAAGVLFTLECKNQFNQQWCERMDFVMTPDQVGALLFGLESAGEAARIASERAAA